VTRALLNAFPTWAIAVIVVGCMVAITLAGLWAVRRWLPSVREGEANEFAGLMAGVIAAVYGVFLAIAIVALYEQMTETESDVRVEAGLLAAIARDGAAIGGPGGERIRASVRDYRDAVVGPEWEAMEDGEQTSEGWDALNTIYTAVRGYEPRGESDSAFYGETVSGVNELVAARRARLHGAEASLPATFMILLIGGAVLTLAFTLVFGVPSGRMHASMAVSLAVLLGFCLLVAFLLDHPFSGELTVSNEPYFQGALQEL
jgi:uncharacterized protein (DUF983 family)